MTMSRRINSPDGWLNLIFTAKAAQNGGVVRRNVIWVEHEIRRQTFVKAVQERGFHLLETGNQFIVICHQGDIQLHF